MLRVGLTGGLATGKTHVARTLQNLGCHVLQADKVGHEVLMPGGAAYAEVVREFGPEILDSDGTIRRKQLAAAVFGKPERLAVLNAIVHPAVFQVEEEWMRQIERAEPSAIAVLEAAILIEAGGRNRVDKLILTVCPEDVQLQRAMKRDGATMEEVKARLAHQMPLSEKLPLADYVIDTSGEAQETEEQTRIVHAALRGLAK